MFHCLLTSMVFDEKHLLILIQITIPLHVMPAFFFAFCLWCIGAWIYLDSLRFLNVEVYVFANVGKVLVFKIFFLTQCLLWIKWHKHLTLKVLMYPISLKLCFFFVFQSIFSLLFSALHSTVFSFLFLHNQWP